MSESHCEKLRIKVKNLSRVEIENYSGVYQVHKFRQDVLKIIPYDEDV